MAEQIQVTTAGRADADATMPNDPDAARAEIQATRERISETIDEIEEVLLSKKEQIQDRLDIFATVREKPFQTLGIVFGAGLVLGLLTGGGDDEEESAHRRGLGTDDRSEMWEHRARRLLRIAREQEEELERLRAASRISATAGIATSEVELDEEEDEDFDDEPSVLEQVRDAVAARIADYVSDSVRRMARGY